MAKATKQQTEEILGKKNNAHLSVAHHTVNDETGKVIKGMFYLTITTEKGTLQVNVGSKTYNAVRKLTGVEEEKK